jgi:RNA methyltransferase, TrmH family
MQIGRHSPKLPQLRKALQHGSLTAEGLLPIEGPLLFAEAEHSGIEIVDVFVRTGTAPPPGYHAHEVPVDVFKTIQDTEHSQGLVATVRPHQFDLADIVKLKPALIVVLCRLQDPGNVGTILRVSEAFGATGCIALRGTASLYNSKAVRATAGSLFRLPHTGAANPADVAKLLRSEKIHIVGTSPTSESRLEKWDWTKPTAVLVGNEGSGLNSEELSYCDTVLRISHKSTVESLNSAIATAVLLYEASKQRHV